MSSNHFLRLSELSGLVSEVMEQVFQGRGFWVIADVTSHSYKPGKNHHYFDLVEKEPGSSTLLARFSARAWNEGSDQIAVFEETTGQRFTNDINVLLLVSVNYHAAFGLQLVVHNIDVNFTLGTLEKQKQANLARLVDENPDHVRLADGEYVTFNQELHLHSVLQRLAVISSSTSAGYEDFQHTLQNNKQGYAFTVDAYFTVVQGENNARYIVEQLIAIYRSGINYDAVIIIRGGGAQTDLLLFEQYAIGKAIARFPIPVITGIGHQKNQTVADLMAHTALKTPTQAAEFIIARNRDFADYISLLQNSIAVRAQQHVSACQQEVYVMHQTLRQAAYASLNTANNKLQRRGNELAHIGQIKCLEEKLHLTHLSDRFAKLPDQLLFERQCELDTLNAKLGSNVFSNLINHRQRLEMHALVLRLLSPDSILRKGFAILKLKDDVIDRSKAIKIGDEVQITTADERLTANITNITKHDRG
ncbi:exodeoxyribonuclease VII large subunit [Mucilaginibacter sp. CSA2-8R]|uniref:exodeoxyribonuclease VII large subunit n=1 Tax=Mucilaginibacter sp. CSA2-8R TaxID=3141542 RepID=UPI00315C63BE